MFSRTSQEAWMASRSVVVCAIVVTMSISGMSMEARGQCEATELIKLTASDGEAEDWYGSSVAIDGDLAIVGAPDIPDLEADPGAAYIYRYDGEVWIEEEKLLAFDGQSEDQFGIAVAISSNFAVVGASGDDDLGANVGSAYVFRFDGINWNFEAKLFPPSSESERFGASIGISLDRIVVGATSIGEAAPLVFHFDRGKWVSETVALLPDHPDAFYPPVSISDTALIVGAPDYDGLGANSGVAFVLRLKGATWTVEETLVPSDIQENDRFGSSVAIHGETAMVGAIWDDDPCGDGELCDTGSVYVFRFDGKTWNEVQKLVASDAVIGDRFGHQVALSGDTALIAAFSDDGAGSGSGSTYAFRHDPKTLLWSEVAKLKSSDAAAQDVFGIGVGASVDRAIVGAYWDDENGNRSGSAYYFAGFSDCNDNGTVDLCDVANGDSLDDNGNGFPDECDGDTVGPDDFIAFRGFYNSGDLNSLLDSDDDKLCYNPGIVLFPTEAPVTLDFFGTLPNDSPASLDVTIESSANTVGLELTISNWNFNTNSWDVVGAATQSFNTDTVRTFAGNPADHVEAGTGEVRTRYEVRVVSFIFVFPWLDCIDHVFWTTSN